MTATVISRERYEARDARESGADLWLPLDELTPALGWESKPQGICFGESCVPIPPTRRAEFFDADERFNVTAFARYLGQPVVRDEPTHTWAIGDAPEARKSALRSADAPDFTLPDLDGKFHSLSDYRGKKVLLLSWASW